MLREIGAFAAGGGNSLSGASRATLEATREVHLKIDTWKKYRSIHPDEVQSLLIAPTGALRSGRVVTRITMKLGMNPWVSEVRVGLKYYPFNVHLGMSGRKMDYSRCGTLSGAKGTTGSGLCYCFVSVQAALSLSESNEYIADEL